ncbi:MAG: response regulator [Bdellovibrionales bacterium]|nr:response regulator [Bdellovibrionales bacterium]
MHSQDSTVLVVEDDEPFRVRISRALSRRGFIVHAAADYNSGYSLIETLRPDYALLDLSLGKASGLDLLPEFRKKSPNTKITILTGYGSISTTVVALKNGAHHYLTKPAALEEIVSSFSQPGSVDNPSSEESYPTLSQVEWEYIQKILHGCGGNVTQAAKKLGLHRRSLQRKLAKHPEKLI